MFKSGKRGVSNEDLAKVSNKLGVLGEVHGNKIELFSMKENDLDGCYKNFCTFPLLGGGFKFQWLHEHSEEGRKILLKDLYEMEVASYPPDEAATLEKLTLRVEKCPHLFLALLQNGKLVGFVNGTASKSPDLEHDSMSIHEEGGTLLCIHSVVVESSLRRKGIALIMLTEYVQKVKRREFAKIALLTKPHHVQLYKKVGFKELGESPVVHGQEKWICCVLNLK